MLIRFKVQRNIPITILMTLALIFAISGILLIIEQQSRRNHSVQDEGMNVAVALGPLFLVIGMLLFIADIALFVYTETVLKEQISRTPAVDIPPPRTDQVFTIGSDATTPRRNSVVDDADYSYAPRFDDDLVAFEPHADAVLSLQLPDEVAPGGPQLYSEEQPTGGAYPITEGDETGGPVGLDVNNPSWDDSSGDLSHGNQQYMYGYIR